MPLFEVAVIEVPSDKEAETGGKERLAFGPKCVIAKDSQAAALRALLDDPDAKGIDKDRMKVLVRPFA